MAQSAGYVSTGKLHIEFACGQWVLVHLRMGFPAFPADKKAEQFFTAVASRACDNPASTAPTCSGSDGEPQNGQQCLASAAGMAKRSFPGLFASPNIKAVGQKGHGLPLGRSLAARLRTQASSSLAWQKLSTRTDELLSCSLEGFFSGRDFL